MRKFKVLAAALALAAVLAFTGVAGAKGAKAGKGAGKQHGVSGKIASIGTDNTSFTITTGGKKNGQTITVTVTNSTTYSVSGKAGSFKDLQAGDRVTIQPDANNPTHIIDKGQGKGHAKKAK